ncbi:nitroreductase family protein [Salsuginibacillus kocurii]|uniref:nitroreductase family protein n=1 Tax=Salsuginibacillus kocurii TaxID=427078 RepID=UPI000367A714|nr:nitroreductase [Salsuginibacillus kocurii]
MDLINGLKTRRTIYDFRDDSIDVSIINEAIECAVLAPNHKMTEPWHFHIIQGDSKEKLALRRGRLKQSFFEDSTSERAVTAGKKGYQFMSDVPYVICVTTQQYSIDPIREQEDYAAVVCAVQNLMLSAWSQGVGSYWGTGPLTTDEEARTLLQLNPEEKIVGFIFMGIPEKVPNVKKRNLNESVTWHS